MKTLALKAFAGAALAHLEHVGSMKASVPFPMRGGGSGGGFGRGLGAGFGNNDPFLNSRQPGSNRDYAASVGELLSNSVVQACVNAKAQAAMEAPPMLERKDGDKWARCEPDVEIQNSFNVDGSTGADLREHLCIEALKHPNAYMTDDHFWSLLIASEDVGGNGYWRLTWNEKSGVPAEIWPVSPWETPIGMLYGQEGIGAQLKDYDPARFIGGYRIWVDGKPDDVTASANFAQDQDRSVDTVIHFRPALNPYNLRLGHAALGAGLRQVEGDNGAAAYQSALVRNVAMASFLVTMKETNSTVTVPQLQAVLDGMERKLKGDGAGRFAGSNLAVDINRAGYSPDEMSLDTLIGYFETRICALLNVPPMVINLMSAGDQKTYANYKEALQDFWRRTIKPRLNRYASELNSQLPAAVRIGPGGVSHCF